MSPVVWVQKNVIEEGAWLLTADLLGPWEFTLDLDVHVSTP